VRLLSTAMVPPTAVRSVRVKGSSACTNNDPIDDVTEQHGDQQEPCPTRHNYDGGRAPYFSLGIIYAVPKQQGDEVW